MAHTASPVTGIRGPAAHTGVSRNCTGVLRLIPESPATHTRGPVARTGSPAPHTGSPVTIFLLTRTTFLPPLKVSQQGLWIILSNRVMISGKTHY